MRKTLFSIFAQIGLVFLLLILPLTSHAASGKNFLNFFPPGKWWLKNLNGLKKFTELNSCPSSSDSSVSWDAPADDYESLTYNNKIISESQEVPDPTNNYGQDDTFTVPFSETDKVLSLSKSDDEIKMKKSGNDLIVTIVAPDKDGTIHTNKWTFEEAFDTDEKLTFKLYLMDLGTGIETLTITGFDLKGALQTDAVDTSKITGGVYLSQGDEKDKWGGPDNAKFLGVTKIEAYAPPFNPTGNDEVSLKVKPDPYTGIMTATINMQDFFEDYYYDYNDGTFYFPSKIVNESCNKIAVKKFKVSATASSNVIVDVLKGDKVLFRYKLVGQEIEAFDPNTGDMKKQKLNAKQVITNKESAFYFNFQLADGGQSVDFLALDENEDTVDGGVNVYGGSGDDLIKANGTVHGGAGDNFIVAGVEGLYAYGEGGDDYLVGDQGEDYLYGGDGDDFIISGEGTAKDTLKGGNDNDMIFVQNPDVWYTVDGGQGKDVSNVVKGFISGIDLEDDDLNSAIMVVIDKQNEMEDKFDD